MFTSFHVLLTGTAPSEDQLPSPSTIRSHCKQLGILDEYNIQQMFVSLANDKSPLNEERNYGFLSDDTVHGDRKKSHVGILTCDDIERGNIERGGVDRNSLDIKEKYRVHPVFILGTTSQAVTADCGGNSDLNIESMLKLVPDAALPLFSTYASDNANDALKEGRDTWEKYMNTLREKGLHDATTSGGIERLLTQIGDSFHIQQLCIKHMSEGACGQTVKGKHDQVHHRQVSIHMI